MTNTEHLLIASGALVANYYATTFSIWFGHWFSHRAGSPLRCFHVGGHHVFYPCSRRSLSERFIYGSGRQDSIYALIPWLILQQVIQFLLLPLWLFCVCFLGTVAVVVLMNHLHTHYHLRGSTLVRYRWFRRARAYHFAHHDADVNFAVVDPFWDRVFQKRRPA